MKLPENISIKSTGSTQHLFISSGKVTRIRPKDKTIVLKYLKP